MNILVIAKATFGEAVRKKVLNIFLLCALALIVFSVSFAYFSAREELTIIKSLGLGVIALAGMFISVVLGINLIPAEIEKRTIYTILAKPVKRHEFLLGKFLGGTLTMLVNLALMTFVFMLTVTYKNHWSPEWDLLKGSMMIFFQLFLLGSVAIFFSIFTTPAVNFFMTSAVYIIGSLSDVTMSLMRDKEQNFVVTWFFKLVHYLVPNFANFFTQNPLIHEGVAIKNEAVYYAQNILYALIYASVLMMIAILVFDRREV
ncbi:MAG: ABC transporter permease [Armatimonadetes bacterium]|nr:ABC transporter permease [Armatimonadota bacterium]